MTWESELYNKCYAAIASKKKWQNRDFDNDFDWEVDELYYKIAKLLKLKETD